MQVLRPQSPALLNGIAAARHFFSARFARGKRGQEFLWVAHVDSHARCINLERFEGRPDSVDLPVRAIVANAARLGSAGVVVAHNHPSGDPMPSGADYGATRILVQAAQSIAKVVVDT